MKTEPLNDLVNLLQFEFPDLPEEVAKRALIRSARQMACIKLSQTTIEICLQECVGHYPLDSFIPDGMEIVCVEQVKHCGCCIPHIEPGTPCPYGYELLDEHNIALHPVPGTADETLEVLVTLRPTYKMCELPADYMCRYEEPLLDGARSLVSEMPNQLWTNVQYSRLMRQKALGKLNSLAAKLNSSGQAVSNQSMTTGECVV